MLRNRGGSPACPRPSTRLTFHTPGGRSPVRRHVVSGLPHPRPGRGRASSRPRARSASSRAAERLAAVSLQPGRLISSTTMRSASARPVVSAHHPAGAGIRAGRAPTPTGSRCWIRRSTARFRHGCSAPGPGCDASKGARSVILDRVHQGFGDGPSRGDSGQVSCQPGGAGSPTRSGSVGSQSPSSSPPPRLPAPSHPIGAAGFSACLRASARGLPPGPACSSHSSSGWSHRLGDLGLTPRKLQQVQRLAQLWRQD